MSDSMVSSYQAPQAFINRSSFDRSSTYKTTLDSGYIYPIFFDEVLPGDTHQMNATVFGRLTTPFVPPMDNIYCDLHWFFIPFRLIWDNFKKFMGERINPIDSIDYLEPQILSGETGFPRYGLMDYFTIPPEVPNLSVSAKFSRSYNLVWNEWYRDENLQDSVKVDTGDGPDNFSDYVLLKRGKRGDYFTTCLPQPQKGPGVELPLGATAPVYGSGPLGVATVDTNWPAQLGTSFGQPVPNYNLSWVDVRNSGVQPAVNERLRVASPTDTFPSNLYADLSSATSATINTLRQAIALQQFLERDMRGGTRYIELVLSHFGVVSPDARLQRPEYLGGSTTMVNISPIAQTSSSDNTSPQGNLAAYVTVSSTGNGFTRSFTEHGVILGLCSVRTDLTYQQGIDRHFSRKTRYDYFWPTLARLGEQSVLNKEIFAQGTSADDSVFGYQERYAEYRFKNSYITGKFRSSDPQSLDVWHFSQNFESLPQLNSQFIEENPPIKRALAIQDEPEFMFDFYFDYTSIRPIPVYGTPGLVRI